jgi:hypothetical protein
MASNTRGVPSTLIRPVHPEADAPADPAAVEGDEAGGSSAEMQGRGEARPSSASPRPRRRKGSGPAEKTNKRGLHLTDAVWDRLQLEAIRKRTTVSAIAGECLDRNLPRLRIERDA